MAAILQEKFTGRKLSGTGAERKFIVSAATDEADALTKLLTTDSTFNGFPRIDNECDVEEVIPGDLYLGTVVYRTPSYSDMKPADFRFSFDISGQQQHITHSLSTIFKAAASGETLVDYDGVIGVDETGNVNGTDIYVPVMTFKVTYVKTDEEVDEAYIVALNDTVGKVNSATFKGFIAGTLLLVGVSGTKRYTNNAWVWDLEYSFAVQRNKTGASIGGITFDKEGWDYLWIKYREDTATVSSVTVSTKKVVSLYIERVYERSEYTALGI